jgi:hypothetical protein
LYGSVELGLFEVGCESECPLRRGGVVEGRVDPAEGVNCLGNHVLNISPLRYIRGHKMRQTTSISDIRRQFFSGFHSARSQHHTGSGFRKRAYRCPADPGAAPGDKHNLPVK